MRLGLSAGPMLLLLWQVAPYGATRDSTGRTRLSVGFGAGQYESRSLDCSGNVLGAEPVRYQTGSVELDTWASQRTRLIAFGGVLSTAAGERFHGPFGGALVAFEWQPVGIGAGFGGMTGEDGFWAPAGYLRLGSIDRVHFRSDFLGPETAFGTTGLARAGFAFNQGHLRGPSGFVGTGFRPYGDERYAFGVFGEFSFPVGERLDVRIAAGARPGAEYLDAGLAGGLRYRLGR